MIDPRVTWRGIQRHPLASRHPWRALWNVLRWRIVSRGNSTLDLPFVDQTVLRASRSMTGLTGNLYFGLHEYEAMSFALHLLRPGDHFADIGANAGSYTVLAAGVRGARVRAIEPDPEAARALAGNINANRLHEQVIVDSTLISNEVGERAFSAGLDTINHVLSAAELRAGASHRRLPCSTIDRTLAGFQPTLIKIDIEGEEQAAIDGAEATLYNPSLLALIIECNDDSVAALAKRLRRFGFLPAQYAPEQRRLTPRTTLSAGNTLFVRLDLDIHKRLAEAPAVRVHPLQCLV